MKFFIPLLAATASASILKRQVSTVSSAVSSISDATTALNNGVTAFSGAADVASLQSLSDALLAAINSGNSAVSPIATLSETDAYTLATPIGNLGTLVSSTIDNVISKKSTFVGAGAGQQVYNDLVAQQSAATAFSQTVLSKIPASLSTIATGLAQPITDALARGVAAYQDQANASGPTTTGGAAPTSGGATTTGTYITTGLVPPTVRPSPTGGNGWNNWNSAPVATTKVPAYTTKAPVATYTGGAVAQGASFGVAVAALAAAML